MELVLDKVFKIFYSSIFFRQINYFDAFNKYGMELALFTTEGRISLLPLEEREIYTRDVLIPAIQVNHPDMKYTLDDYRELVDNVIFVDGQETLLNSDHRILKITSNSPDHESSETTQRNSKRSRLT